MDYEEEDDDDEDDDEDETWREERPRKHGGGSRSLGGVAMEPLVSVDALKGMLPVAPFDASAFAAPPGWREVASRIPHRQAHYRRHRPHRRHRLHRRHC